MLRQMFNRAGALALIVAVVGLALATTSCGSSGDSPAAKPMVLLEFLFVDRSLEPTAPTGTENLPRNAQLYMVFSELVNPDSVNNQTVQVRYGAAGQSVPQGSFSVDGNTVRFDPTVTAQGQPNPFGFLSTTQYLVDIPSFDQQTDVIRNLDEDPNLQTFFTTFVTSDGYLRELIPPEIVRVYSIPDRWEINPLTGQWPGNGIMAFEFSEPMAPASFVLGGFGGPDVHTTIDVRYDADADVNPPLLKGVPIPGFFTADPAATTYFFNPTFSFGAEKYVFNSQVFQGLKDLSGNLLVNPRSFGDYTCDGTGISTGKILNETFLTFNSVDFAVTDADWGNSEEGVLQGQDISSRNVFLYGWQLQDSDGDGVSDDLSRVGQYSAIISPLIGAALNTYVSNISPPTSEGRRVLWSFADTEMGSNGTITAAAWGPDSNATFAAIYPKIVLRCGYQKQASMNLSPSFAGNYEGAPLIVYSGEYRVSQAANVGPPAEPYPKNSGDPNDYSVNPGCAAGHQAPLFNSIGFQAWPELATFFDWEPGDPLVDGDRVFLFDASCEEGDTWQQIRGWFGVTYPCSGVLIPGYPNRRMYTTYEGETPNPQSNFGAGILNPEPSMTDTSFTVTKRVSLAQVLFYTDGNQPNEDPSRPTTFGADSDYLTIQLTPQVQTGGAAVRVEFNAAQAVEGDHRTINQALPFLPGWTETIDDCDGFRCIRWRIQLISNLISGQRASLTNVTVPLIQK